MLKNITAIIFAVITLVAFLARENMAHLMVTLKSKSFKFGETLAVQTVGNPEPSPMWSERCRDLTGDNLKGLVKEKVRHHKKLWIKLLIFPTVITSVQAITAITDIGKKIKVLPSLIEILSRKILKFGETLTSNVDGNPEPSPMWSERCRDLTGIKSERYLKEKVHSDMKISGNNDKLPSSSFHCEFDSIGSDCRWCISGSFNSVRGSEKKWRRAIAL